MIANVTRTDFTAAGWRELICILLIKLTHNYEEAINGDLFVTLLKQMMLGRRKPLHLVADGLPVHKTKSVREYVDSLKGKLTLHFLPGNALDLNPDELLWGCAMRTGRPRHSQCAGETLAERVNGQLP
jgi:transposase